MKKFIKKILGLEEVEANIALASRKLEEIEKAKKEVEEELVRVKEQEELARLSPKERATRKKEPWISVLNTHVNKDNIRNGFFELDWNEYFVLKLKQEGYGFDGDKDEEIVDRWFRELCANVVVDEGGNLPVSTGMIDIKSVKKNNQ